MQNRENDHFHSQLNPLQGLKAFPNTAKVMLAQSLLNETGCNVLPSKFFMHLD